MSVQGIFLSHQHIAGQRTGDFESALLFSQRGGSTPLLAVSSGFANEAAKDSVVTWFEETALEGRAQLGVAITNGTDATITVVDGSPYGEGTIFEVEATGEFIMVTAVNGNVLSIERGISGTTAAGAAINTFLHRIGNAHEESSSMPTPVSNQGAPRVNVTQIFRNSWGISGTADAITYRQGDKKAKNKRDAMTFHAEDKERAFIWGKKHIGVRNGKPFRLCDGLVSQIEQYGGLVEAAGGGTMSLKELRNHIRQLFAYNVKGLPNERISYCGDVALQAFAEAAEIDGHHSFTTEDTAFGISVSTFVSPFGKLKLMTHPMFNMHPEKAKQVLNLHPGTIKRRILRATHESKDPQSNAGVDAMQGDFLAEETIVLGVGKVHSLITGVAAGSASNP